MSSDSSFYNKKPDTNRPLRTFEVSDPDMMESHATQAESPPSEIFQKGSGYELSAKEREELMRARRTGMLENSMGGYAKQRIEILANVGRLTKNVDIDGIIFSLRSLKNRETKEASISITKCNSQIEASFELKKQLLARAIYQIDGQTIEDAVGGNDLELRLQLVDNLDDGIFDILFAQFESLKNEIMTKYAPSNEKTAKEVMQDLKK